MPFKIPEFLKRKPKIPETQVEASSKDNYQEYQNGDKVTLQDGRDVTVFGRKMGTQYRVEVSKGQFEMISEDQINDAQSETVIESEAPGASYAVGPDGRAVSIADEPPRDTGGVTIPAITQHDVDRLVNDDGDLIDKIKKTKIETRVAPSQEPEKILEVKIDQAPTTTAAAVPPERRSFFKRHGGKLALAAAGLMLAAGLAREYVGNLFSSDDSRGSDTELQTDKPAVPDFEGVVNAANATTEATPEVQPAAPRTIHVDAVPGKGAIAAVQKAAREKGVRISANLAEDVALGLYGDNEDSDTFDMAGKTVEVNDVDFRLKRNPKALKAFHDIFDTGTSEAKPLASVGPSESGMLVADATGDDGSGEKITGKPASEWNTDGSSIDLTDARQPTPISWLPEDKPVIQERETPKPDPLDIPLTSLVELNNGINGYVLGINDDDTLIIHTGTGEPAPGTYTADDIARVITKGTGKTIGEVLAQREREAAIAKAAIDPIEAPDRAGSDFSDDEPFEMKSPEEKKLQAGDEVMVRGVEGTFDVISVNPDGTYTVVGLDDKPFNIVEANILQRIDPAWAGRPATPIEHKVAEQTPMEFRLQAAGFTQAPYTEQDRQDAMNILAAHNNELAGAATFDAVRAVTRKISELKEIQARPLKRAEAAIVAALRENQLPLTADLADGLARFDNETESWLPNMDTTDLMYAAAILSNEAPSSKGTYDSVRIANILRFSLSRRHDSRNTEVAMRAFGSRYDEVAREFRPLLDSAMLAAEAKIPASERYGEFFTKKPKVNTSVNSPWTTSQPPENPLWSTNADSDNHRSVYGTDTAVSPADPNDPWGVGGKSKSGNSGNGIGNAAP